MTWVKLDDNFPEHRKVAELHDRAFRLHVVALCYCGRNNTDGYLDDRAIRVVHAVLGTNSKRWMADLVDSGLWIDHGDGRVEIKDFTTYNPTAAEVKELREARREAGRRGGQRSGESRRSKRSKTEALASSTVLEPRPVPSRSTPKGFSDEPAGSVEKPWDLINLKEVG